MYLRSRRSIRRRRRFSLVRLLIWLLVPVLIAAGMPVFFCMAAAGTVGLVLLLGSYVLYTRYVVRSLRDLAAPELHGKGVFLWGSR